MYGKLLTTTFLLCCLALGYFLLLLSLNRSTRFKRLQEIFGNTFLILGALSAFCYVIFINKADESFASISLVALSGVIATMSVAASLYFRSNSVATFMAPMAIIVLFIEQFFIAPKATNLHEIDMLREQFSFRAISIIHISFATLGIAFALLASAAAIFYLWQRQLLRKKRIQDLNSGAPGLDKLDRLLMRSLWLGFSFLTLSLVTGPIVVSLSNSSFESIKIKIFLAIAVWLWYLTTIGLRVVFHLRPTQIAKLSFLGFIIVAFMFWGVYILFPLRMV